MREEQFKQLCEKHCEENENHSSLSLFKAGYELGKVDGMNAGLMAERIIAKAEIERLKELIEQAYDAGYACFDDIVSTCKSKWHSFKSENNL